MTEGICPTCGQTLPNFVPMPLERCVHCKEVFAGNSQPQWLFAPNLILRGRVHTTCSYKYGRRLISPGGKSPEEARRWVWSYSLNNTIDVAYLFTEGRERREELLARWHKGPRQLSAAVIVEIRQALEDAERRYREQFPEPLASEG